MMATITLEKFKLIEFALTNIRAIDIVEHAGIYEHYDIYEYLQQKHPNIPFAPFYVCGLLKSSSDSRREMAWKLYNEHKFPLNTLPFTSICPSGDPRLLRAKLDELPNLTVEEIAKLHKVPTFSLENFSFISMCCAHRKAPSSVVCPQPHTQQNIVAD